MTERQGIRLTPWVAAVLCLLLAALLAGRANAGDPPRRIVSINLCADQLLLMLVPRERIAAVSFIADDPEVSAMATEAAGMPQVHSEAEEVLAYDPDLVLDGTFSIRPTVSLLRRMGVRVEQVEMSTSLEGIRRNVAAVADFVGDRNAGRRIIADFDRRLAALPATDPRPPSAVVYFIGGLAAGAGTLEDAALEAAGFRNLAADRGLHGLAPLPLESLLLEPPDLMVMGIGSENYRTNVADNLRHPALKALLRRVPTLRLDPALLVCDTPRVIEAIEALAAERIRLRQVSQVAGKTQ